MKKKSIEKQNRPFFLLDKLVSPFFPQEPLLQERAKTKDPIVYYEELRRYWTRRHIYSTNVRRMVSIYFILCWSASLLLALFWPLITGSGRNNDLLSICVVLFTYGCIFLFVYYLHSPKNYKKEIERIDYEIDFLEAQNLASEESRAQRIFKYHQSELKGYYDQALISCRSIFKVGLLSIFLGFVIIGITFVLLCFIAGKKIEGGAFPYLTAALGSIGTILSNYIGLIYVKMYSNILSSFSTLQYRLVTTHHLHLANCIIAKIKNPNKKDETLAKMALSISSRAHLDHSDKYDGNEEEKKPDGI
jgi:hypothetical protein